MASPRDQPAEVGREAAVQVEAERAGHVPGGERPAGPQVHHPFSRLDPPSSSRHPPGAARSGWARPARRRWPGPCAHSKRDRRSGRPQLGHLLVLVQDQRWVDLPLPADRRGVALGLGRRESCRTRGWGTRPRPPAAQWRAGAPRRTGRAPARRRGRGRAGPAGRSSRGSSDPPVNTRARGRRRSTYDRSVEVCPAWPAPASASLG